MGNKQAEIHYCEHNSCMAREKICGSVALTIFAERLKGLRNERGVNIRQLADGLGVGQATISYWETCMRTPTIEMLYRVAKFFNISADYLIGLDN